jgi:hypothetical protein
MRRTCSSCGKPALWFSKQLWARLCASTAASASTGQSVRGFAVNSVRTELADAGLKSRATPVTALRQSARTGTPRKQHPARLCAGVSPPSRLAAAEVEKGLSAPERAPVGVAAAFALARDIPHFAAGAAARVRIRVDDLARRHDVPRVAGRTFGRHVGRHERLVSSRRTWLPFDEQLSNRNRP